KGRARLLHGAPSTRPDADRGLSISVADHFVHPRWLEMLKKVETLESQGGVCEVNTRPATIAKSSPLPGVARTKLHIALVAAIFIAVMGTLYSAILRDLVWQWWDDANYSHGFLVPVFSGFIVWQRRKELAALPQHGSWMGLAVLMVGVVELILGDI